MKHRSAQTQNSHALLICFSETETGVNGNKGVGILEDKEISAEETEEQQKKKGVQFNLLCLLLQGISVCSLFLCCYSMHYKLQLPPSLQMTSCRGHWQYSLMFRMSSAMLRRFWPALKSGGVLMLTLTIVHTFLSVCQSC